VIDKITGEVAVWLLVMYVLQALLVALWVKGGLKLRRLKKKLGRRFDLSEYELSYR